MIAVSEKLNSLKDMQIFIFNSIIYIWNNIFNFISWIANVKVHVKSCTLKYYIPCLLFNYMFKILLLDKNKCVSFFICLSLITSF